MKPRHYFFAVLFALLLASRLCHSGILWAEEGLPLAAAAEMLRGKLLYRDIWFDKPPLLAAIYLSWAARSGWPLRLAGTLYAMAAAGLSWRFAWRLWGPREACWAAGLMAFFLTCDFASAVIPLAADLLMLVPHMAAVYFAWRRRAFASGLCAGVAFLLNAKGILVIAACALWGFPALLPFLVPLALGFALPNVVAGAWLWSQGALPAYVQQVWIWGRLYAAGTFLTHPVRDALVRVLDWLGFHAALAMPAAWFFWRAESCHENPSRWKWAAWGLLSFAGVALGWRFFPRYFFQALPVLVLAAARGFSLLPRRYAVAMAALLLIPFLRFAPRYGILAWQTVRGIPSTWADVAMDQDSRAAAGILKGMAHPGSGLFVWGFRPELYVYTGLPAATRYLDSQPLTGVPADRHLTQSKPVETELTRIHRRELTHSRPDFILDGLGLYNPSLAIQTYSDLSPWLKDYQEVARSRETIVYRLRAGAGY